MSVGKADCIEDYDLLHAQMLSAQTVVLKEL